MCNQSSSKLKHKRRHRYVTHRERQKHELIVFYNMLVTMKDTCFFGDLGFTFKFIDLNYNKMQHTIAEHSLENRSEYLFLKCFYYPV